jgi:translation initiation factor IF-3
LLKKPYFNVNNRINAKQVRLIDVDGTQIGVRPVTEALALARTRGLDLVEIAPQANPPVCKVLDFSKFLYEQEKQQREARKKQKAGLLKEVRVRPNIGSHDLEIKMKHIKEFLGERDKVRVTVVFRGRENQHKDLGIKMLNGISEQLKDLAAPEGHVQSLGNRIMLTLVPK